MTTTAAEKVAGSRYLLDEILIRLPAKSLAQSKLVSKQWLSQISNPQFLQHHSRHRPNKLPTGMFLTNRNSICSQDDIVPFSELNPTHQMIPSLGFLYECIKQIFGDYFYQIQLLNSCNGLLLCLVVTLKDLNSPYRPKYCVCNPTTKKFRLLSETPFCVPSTLNKCLAFDPSLSLHYKVICTNLLNNRHEICIYSSENQCWSTYASPSDPWGEWFFLNGSMYSTGKSLRFDVHAEKMEQITMPPRTVNYLWNYLTVMGSHVYCAVRKAYAEADLQVLEMSSDFSKWIPKYDVNVSPLLSAFPEIKQDPIPGFFKVCYHFDAICVVDGVKEDESDLVLGIPESLFCIISRRRRPRNSASCTVVYWLVPPITGSLGFTSSLSAYLTFEDCLCHME